MLTQLSFNPIKISLGFLLCLNGIHILTQKSHAATLRLFPETIDSLSLQEVTPLEFLDEDLLSQLIPIQQQTITFNDAVDSQTLTQAISKPSDISLDSIVSSLNQLRFDTEREAATIDDIPVLPQVDAADVYKDIYDFSTTAAEELSDPISVGVLPPLDAIPSSTPTGGIGTTGGNRVAGSPRPNLSQPALPRFGGPVAIIGGPSRNFAAPLSQVGLPSATRIQAGNWGDTQVNVFFASLPKQEIVDVDTFVRTVYRTSLSEAIQKIDATLDLSIDADFSSMPANVFPSNPMPSGGFNRTL
ncbi:MAG: hypothetical protein AB4063_21785 [Crocosphaera sp.]